MNCFDAPVLGIETSCDETSCAVLDGTTVLSNVVSSQAALHEKWGGIVPEAAARAHVESILPVVDESIKIANVGTPSAIAVTNRPGLIGALSVGATAAKALSMAWQVPMIGVHHLEGHVVSTSLEGSSPPYPHLCLIVSGGHTELILVSRSCVYRQIGGTIDDAAGEAFDKVATLLGLSYPGGPNVERIAKQGTDRFLFPRPMLDKGLDFSFSGLKTAVLYAVRKSDDIERDRADLAASFQQAVFDVLLTKTKRALEQTGYSRVVFGGGVACSTTLTELAAETFRGSAEFYVASQRLNTDNAAMIGRAGWFHLEAGREHDHYLDANARFPWPGLH